MTSTNTLKFKKNMSLGDKNRIEVLYISRKHIAILGN